MPLSKFKPVVYVAATAVFGALAVFFEHVLQVSDHDLAMRATRCLGKLEANMRPFVASRQLPPAIKWNELGIAGTQYSAIGELTAWTTNEVPFDPLTDLRAPQGISVLKLKGGYYLRMVEVDSTGRTVLYGLIRQDLPFNNKFIVDRWGPMFPFDPDTKVSISGSMGESVMLDGAPVLHIWHNPSTLQKPHWAVVVLWLVTFGFFLLILIAWDQKLAQSTSRLSFFIVPTLLVIVRLVMLVTQRPSAVYSLSIFSPDLYAASAFIPSLGDLFLHVAFLLYFSKRIASRPLKIEAGPGYAILGAFAFIAAPKLLYLLIDSLVNDSTIALDLSDPTSLNQWSVCTFLIIAMAAWAWLIMAQWWARAFGPSVRVYKWIVASFAIGSIGAQWHNNPGLVPFAAVVVGIGAYLVFMPQLSALLPKNFRSLPIIMLLAALINAAWIPALNRSDGELRQTIARRTLLDQDPVAEHLFTDLRNAMVNDRNIRNCLAVSPVRDAELLEEIRSKFTYGHWQRYTVGISLFDRNGGLLVSDQGITGPNFNEAMALISQSAPTVSEGLFFKGGWDANGGYLATLNFEGRRGNSGGQTLLITLNPIRLIRSTGLDEVLLDDAFGTDIGMGRYSVARYKDGALVESRGDFPYALFAQSHKTDPEGEVVQDGILHSIFSDSSNTQVWVSRKRLGPMSWFTCYSYILFFGLALGAIHTFVFNGQFRSVRWGFRGRVTLAVSGMLALSLILMGALTGYFVSKQFDLRNREALTERAGSVLMELESKLKDRDALSKTDADLLGRLLAKFSGIFLSDLSIYNPQGQMLATSRPRLIESGITGPVMEPQAFTEMRVNGHSSFVQTEKIGSLNYLAAYVPVRNGHGQTIAFLGLPYFGRQYSLRRETATLLAALTDLFTVLILLSVVIALILADRITGPLAILQSHMEKLSLDGKDSLIDWKGNDEVGDLVKAYNRAVTDLMHSAELLAKREREDAWREMARQVAHEIKNPLTPMRLSIQMLERSHRDGAPDMPDRITRVSNTLIEQIDALARIATEFSEFAQMPGPILAEVDLRQLLTNLQSLFGDHPEFDFLVEVEPKVPAQALVKADHDQLIRILNNLVRNAIQAIPEERKGHIEVRLSRAQNHYSITVSDNGSGMTEEVQAKAFVPNFSTKSSGMGLGLAMVKGMVEGMGGGVSFTSEVNVGTQFVVNLPAL